MVEVIEVKDFESRGWNHHDRVKVTSLEELKKIADGYGEPFIFVKGKEHRLYRQFVCYRYER